jgi:protease II
VFSKIMDNHPNLKIITHHFGGIVPMLEGRIGPGWDVLGSRTSDEDYVTLRNDRFYVHTNQEAPRYRYFQVDPQKPGRDQWREIIAQEKDVLQGVVVIGDTLVADRCSAPP